MDHHSFPVRTLLCRKTLRPATLKCKATTLNTRPRRKKILFTVKRFGMELASKIKTLEKVSELKTK